jgi:hypothetical protein
MLFVSADCEFISLGEAKRQHAKVLHQRPAIDANFQIADELIEREFDSMLFGETVKLNCIGDRLYFDRGSGFTINGFVWLLPLTVNLTQ